MGFLNPTALLFGGLYAVLVVLYLWQRQRRQVDVPSLLLWQDVPEEVVRSSRFRPDLLFFLQLLILTLLIAGLAQPYFEHAATGPQPSRHVFVLDSSASMAAREGRASRFDEARDAISERIASLREPDEIMLMTAAQRPRVVLPFTRDHATVLTQLRSLIPTDSGTNLALALVVAQSASVRSDLPTFVHLYTDVPPSELESGWRETADVTQLGETDNNVGIEAFDVRHDAFGDYRTAYAHLTVRNFAHREAHGFISLHAGGTVLRRDGFSLPARESRTFLYQDLTHAGVLEAVLETDDALAADNHAYAWLRPERHMRVLVVSPPSALRNDLSTIAAATPNIEVRFIEPEAYEHATARDADVVLFHRFVPTSDPPRPQLYVYPPAGNPLFPVHAHIANARVLTWNENHAAWRDLRPASAFPIAHTQLVETPPWAELLLSADSASQEIPLAFSGERAGQRIACLTFDLAREHLVRADNISLLLFVLNVLDWLAPARDGVTLVHTGATETITDMPALPRRITDPRGVISEIAGDGPDTIEALYAGLYEIAADGTHRRLLANFFDADESDIGRPAREAVMAPIAPPRTRAAGASFSTSLLLTALAVLIVEWLLARQAQSG
jgi:hypothetical protein